MTLRPPGWLARPLVAALAVRLLALLLLAPHVPVMGDALGYVFLGQSLRTDASFPDLQGGVRPPLYPMLVAIGLRDDPAGGATARPWPGVYLVQIAADLAALVVLATLARRLFGSRAASMTAWAHALLPSAALYAGTVVMAESTALLCTAVAIERLDTLDRALTGGPRAWLAPALGLGAALGAGLLVKELIAVVVVAVLVALLLRPGAPGRRLLAGAVALLALLLVTAPWIAHNLERHGVVLLTGSYGHLSVIVDNAPPGESGWAMLQDAPTLRDRMALAHDVLRRQFLEYPALTARRAADRTRMLLGPEVMLPAWVAHGFDGYQPDARSNLLMVRDAWTLPPGVGRRLQQLLDLADVVFFALAAAGLALAGACTLRRAALLATAGLLLSTALTVAIARYRLAIVPFLLPFVGLSLAALADRAVRATLARDRRRAALRAGLIAGAALTATILLLPPP